MSRCFIFTPTDYGRHGEALIEPIKLREEMEKAEKERKEKKEKKREKKEKKREKKEKKEKKREKKERRRKEKERKLKEGSTTSHGTDDGKKLRLINELEETKVDGKLQKGEDSENEQRSGITHELDHPVTSVEPCCMSDSTQTSKRKRSSPQSTPDHGPAIKIRLSLRKHREPDELKSKSILQMGPSYGNVGGDAESFSRITLGIDHRSQGLVNTVPNRVLGNSESRQLLQNSVHGDAVATKNTLGSSGQSQSLIITETKRVLGNSDNRNGKVMQNSVHRDAVVTKNTLGSDHQSQCLRVMEPKRVLGNSDSRDGTVKQNLVQRDAMVSKNILASGRQPQCEPKRVVENSKVKHNSVHEDVVVTKNTLGSGRPSKSPTTTKPKHGNSDSKHCKPLQKLVHGDNAIADAMDIDIAVVADGSQKMESLYKSMLQIPPLTFDRLDPVDEDWLFSSERTGAGSASKKQKFDSDVFQLSNSMWPRAQYLPEVQVYALPYAVPF